MNTTCFLSVVGLGIAHSYVYSGLDNTYDLLKSLAISKRRKDAYNF